jgi:hypothetical protein
MASSPRITAISNALTAPRFTASRPRPEAPSWDPVEQVWDAVVVEDEQLPAPGWLSGSALSLYGRAGFERPAPLVDLRA